MKKFLLPVFVTILTIISFVSCEGPMGPEGSRGPEGTVNMTPYYFHVRANQWKTATDNDGTNLYYYCTLDFPALNLIYTMTVL